MTRSHLKLRNIFRRPDFHGKRCALSEIRYLYLNAPRYFIGKTADHIFGNFNPSASVYQKPSPGIWLFSDIAISRITTDCKRLNVICTNPHRSVCIHLPVSGKIPALIRWGILCCLLRKQHSFFRYLPSRITDCKHSVLPCIAVRQVSWKSGTTVQHIFICKTTELTNRLVSAAHGNFPGVHAIWQPATERKLLADFPGNPSNIYIIAVSGFGIIRCMYGSVRLRHNKAASVVALFCCSHLNAGNSAHPAFYWRKLYVYSACKTTATNNSRDIVKPGNTAEGSLCIVALAAQHPGRYFSFYGTIYDQPLIDLGKNTLYTGIFPVKRCLNRQIPDYPAVSAYQRLPQATDHVSVSFKNPTEICDCHIQLSVCCNICLQTIMGIRVATDQIQLTEARNLIRILAAAVSFRRCRYLPPFTNDHVPDAASSVWRNCKCPVLQTDCNRPCRRKCMRWTAAAHIKRIIFYLFIYNRISRKTIFSTWLLRDNRCIKFSQKIGKICAIPQHLRQISSRSAIRTLFVKQRKQRHWIVTACFPGNQITHK